MVETQWLPPAATTFLAYIRDKYGSIPKFCEATGLDRLKVQKICKGGVKRCDVDFAFDIERITNGKIKARHWCTPEEIRLERRARMSRSRSKLQPKRASA